jgi:DNA-binding LytR/AlgR family response regulator
VDDEPLALNVLESYIGVIPSLVLAGKCSNAFEALQALQQTSIDIMFLDIKMPQLSGIDFLKSIRNPPKVIFTTAHKEYALEGYELDVVDYLLKPVSLERFIRAISKIDRKATSDMAAGEVKDQLPNKHFLYFRLDRKMVKIFLDEILYIESDKDYIKIIRGDNPPVRIKQTITSVGDMLPKNQFLRIHRSFIVSISKVKSFTQKDVEINGLEIPVGRDYQQSLKTLLQK